MKNGSITNVTLYAKTYGSNPSTGTVLNQLEYLKKSGAGRNSSYTWHGRKPDQQMVIEVCDALNKYNQRWRTTPSEPSRNLIPATDYKEKVKTEITAEMREQMEDEILNKLIQASNATSFFGINLLSLPPKKIKEFIHKYEIKGA